MINSKKLEGRIDPNPYHPTRLKTVEQIKKIKVPLMHLIQVAPAKRESTDIKLQNEKYVGLEAIESGTGIYLSPEEEIEEFDNAFKFSKGNVLFPKLRPYLNKVHLAEFDGVCSTEFHVLECIGCRNDYLCAFLNSDLILNQTIHLMTGNTHPRLQTEEIEQLVIPVPKDEVQKQIGEKFVNAQKKKNNAIQQSDQILQNIEDVLFKKAGIVFPKIKRRKIFKIKKNTLENALNSERYGGIFNFEPSIKWINILKFGNLVKDTITPQRRKGMFSVIRIDDLEKNPIKSNPRISSADDIEGSQLEVKENDVLISRLGPTILNKKIILCPSSNKPILASPEFLVFRCNDTANPLFVMNVLKANFFTQLMIQKSRGATPSRFRLDSSDFEQLKFPYIKKDVQDDLAKELHKILEQSYELRNNALIIFNEERKKIESEILSTGKQESQNKV